MKIVTVNQEMVALYLAEKGKPHGTGGKKVSLDSKNFELARHFLQQFDVRSLFASLKHKKDQITLDWIVRWWLKLLDSEDAKVSERMMILDRLKELLLLGAIQDRELARSLQTRVTTEKTRPYDPIAGEKKPPLKFTEKVG